MEGGGGQEGQEGQIAAGGPVHRTVYAIRKAHQATREFQVWKCGLLSICRDPNMVACVEECAQSCSIIAVEASLLASMHIMRLLDPVHNEGGEALPVMDDTFFNQCVSSIANLNGQQHDNNPSLTATLYYYYENIKPQGYVNVGRTPAMAQMLVIIAHQARQNFVVSTEQTICKRLSKWLKLRIRQHSVQGDYFSINGPYNGKSIAGLMMRCCLQDIQVAGIMNQYKRIRERPIPQHQIVWMQDLCNDVRHDLEITPQAPLEVSKHPEVYMRFLRRMLLDLENSGEPLRLFSLLPQKKIQPLYITINSTILKHLHKYLQSFEDDPLEVDEEVISLWDYYFDMKRFTRGNNQFENIVSTDGTSASVTVSRPKSAPVPAVLSARQSAANAFTDADRVVAVDPGRNPILSGVVYDREAMQTLPHPDNIHHEKVQWSKKEHYHEAGFNNRSYKTTMWMSKSPEVVQYNIDAISSKTSILLSYMDHAHHVLSNLHDRMAFFSSKRFKRLKFKTHIRTQKAYEKVVKKLKGGVKKTLVVWGDAQFPSAGRGSPAVPTKTMRKKVGARVKVIDQDEFRSSKLSCCCHTVLSNLLIDGERSYHVRVCQNVLCPRSVWDRNVSAAINILYLFINYNVHDQETPAAFRRGGHDPPPVPVAEVVAPGDEELGMDLDEE